MEGKRVAEVERRKTLEEEAKHARARIDYQQALEKKRREEEMHMQVWPNSRFINRVFPFVEGPTRGTTEEAGGIDQTTGSHAQVDH